MCVPLYDTLGANAVEYILQHSEAAAIFSDGSKLKVLSDALPAVKAQVKLVCYWGDAPEEAKKVMAIPASTIPRIPDFLLQRVNVNVYVSNCTESLVYGLLPIDHQRRSSILEILWQLSLAPPNL